MQRHFSNILRFVAIFCAIHYDSFLFTETDDLELNECVQFQLNSQLKFIEKQES